MLIHEDKSQAKYQIKRYQSGELLINDQLIETSVVVTHTKLILPWGPESTADIDETAIEVIIKLQPEVILIGTGTQHRFIEQQLMSVALGQSIGIEVMDSHAAARTYQVLTAENRNVAAGFILY